MNIKEQIAALPDFEFHGLESPDGHDLRSRDLKVLADSHARLLEAAKALINLVGIGVGESLADTEIETELFRAIEEAEAI